MARTLTSDGAHLCGLTNDAAHLVVVRQSVNWVSKELVATPSLKKYAWASAWGVEAYRNTQGGPLVRQDTDVIVNMANGYLAAADWRTGDHAIFANYCRAYSPHALRTDMANPQNYSEYAASAVLLKFNLRHLHLSKMNTWKAYLRAWCPSLVAAMPPPYNPSDAFLFAGGMPNNASSLRLSFFRDEPAHPSAIFDSSVTTANDAWELSGNCNNGRTVAVDTLIDDALIYDAYDQYNEDATKCPALLSRVYAEGDEPALFYHDFEITNADARAFLASGIGTFWAGVRFSGGNGFASDASYNGLRPSLTATAYVQRVELVFKCTGARFNND